jgi:hypothetical protein
MAFAVLLVVMVISYILLVRPSQRRLRDALKEESKPQIGIQVIEFKNQAEYSEWLRRMGRAVKVLNLSTTKRWSFSSGFIGDAKTYTVTYEQALAGISCPQCGAPIALGSKFCSGCAAPVNET